jgi:hypothetical protein
MLEGTEPDPTDKGTQRPNAKPLQKKGNTFILIKCPDFDIEITLPLNTSLDNPISLFTLYYTPEIIESIVCYTNEVPREPQDPSMSYARANAWYLTCAEEIYLYFAIRVYMTEFPIDDVAGYWSSNPLFSQHRLIKFILQDRFQELYIRFRVALPEHVNL